MNLSAEMTDAEFNKVPAHKKPSILFSWIKQQALFFYFLHIPFKWVKWLLGIAICLLIAGGLKHLVEKFLHWVLPEPFETIVNILCGASAGILMISVMLVIFILPSQVVHLVTSKQTLLLKSFRSAILSHIILVPSLYALFIATIFSVIGSNPTAPHFINIFFLVFLLLSSFLHISIYGSQRSATWPFLVGFLVPVYQYLVYKLNSVDWLLLFSGAAISWIVFSIWWLRWKPLEHRAALFTETFTDPTKIQRLQSGFGQGIFAFLQFGLNKNIENLFDGLLLGRAKSPPRIMLAGLAAPIIMSASMVLSIAVLPHSSTNNILQGGQKFSFMFICVFMTMPASQISAALFNIKKSWLFYRGHRSDFFGAFEKLMITQSIYQIIAIVLFIIAISILMHASDAQMKINGLAIMFGTAQSLLITYLQLFLYHQSKARRSLSIQFTIILNLLLMLPVGMTVGFIGERVLTDYLSALIIIMAIVFISAAVLRRLTKHQWQKIEFLRMT